MLDAQDLQRPKIQIKDHLKLRLGTCQFGGKIQQTLWDEQKNIATSKKDLSFGIEKSSKSSLISNWR